MVHLKVDPGKTILGEAGKTGRTGKRAFEGTVASGNNMRSIIRTR